VHVIDASAADREQRTQAVRNVLIEIGAERVPVIDAFNKIDLVEADALLRLRLTHPEALWLSAEHQRGRDELVAAIGASLAMDAERVRLELDDRREGDRRLVADLYRHARVVSHITDAERVSIEADVPRRLLGRFTRAKVPA